MKYFFYKSFINHFLHFYSFKVCSFFLKLRIKGLGYRIRSIFDIYIIFFLIIQIIFIFLILKIYWLKL